MKKEKNMSILFRRNSHRTNDQAPSGHPDERQPAPLAIIYRSEMDYISRCILDYPNIETGGQLFGFLTEYGVPVVCYAIGPGHDANHQIAFFNQDAEYLQSIFDEVNSRYGLCYIGEWHSHHQLGLAKPSGHDAGTVIRGIKRSQFRHFLLCIGNCDRYRRSTLNAFTFHLNDPEGYCHVPWKIIDTDSPYRRLIDHNLAQMLSHPYTLSASHGDNYTVDDQYAATVPDYSSLYWLNSKENNAVLKAIIDYFKDNGFTVKPQLDENKHVHLYVEKGPYAERIIFGEWFPSEAPEILISDNLKRNGNTRWIFNGDILLAFTKYHEALITPVDTDEDNPESNENLDNADTPDSLDIADNADISETTESSDTSETEESCDTSETEESSDISETEESSDISETEESSDTSETAESADPADISGCSATPATTSPPVVLPEALTGSNTETSETEATPSEVSPQNDNQPKITPQ